MIAFMKSRPLEVWTSNGKYRIDIGFDFTLRGESWARLYALHFSRHPDIFVWWLVAVACLKVRYPSLILLTSNVIASKASTSLKFVSLILPLQKYSDIAVFTKVYDTSTSSTAEEQIFKSCNWIPFSMFTVQSASLYLLPVTNWQYLVPCS